MPLIIIAAGVALLLIWWSALKLTALLPFVLVAAVVGFAEGMDAQAVLHSIQNGIGSTLGGLAMILGFGAMLGQADFWYRRGTTYRHYADCYFGKKTYNGRCDHRSGCGPRHVFWSGFCPAVAVGIYHRGIIWITVVCWRTDGSSALCNPCFLPPTSEAYCHRDYLWG